MNHGPKFLAFFLLAALLHSCQSPKAVWSREFPERFTIKIPEKYRAGPKLIKAMGELVPATMEEVEGRQLCMDCKAGYTAVLELGKPMVELYSSGTATLRIVRFSAAFILHDTVGKRIVSLKLIDPNEESFIWEDRTHTSSGTPSPVKIEEHGFMHNGSFWIRDMQAQEAYFSRKVSTRKGYRPTLPAADELMIIVENRIFELVNLLAGNAAKSG